MYQIMNNTKLTLAIVFNAQSNKGLCVCSKVGLTCLIVVQCNSDVGQQDVQIQ